MSSPSQTQLDDLTSAINQILLNQQSFQNHITSNSLDLTTEFHGLRSRLGPPGFGPKYSEITPFPPTSIKLDIPRFDGSDPLGWIFKIKQFFDFHHTSKDQRLRIASFYMEGEALFLFQWMHSNGKLPSWPAFLQALEVRFAPSLYEDPKGSMFKLCQMASVKEYQAQFKTPANRIVGLPPPFYLSYFISGLKPAICREVQAFQPLTLTQAISLAKLQEEKLLDRSPYYQKPSTLPPSPSQIPAPSFKPTFSVTPPRPTTVVKRLSPAELQSHRKKG